MSLYMLRMAVTVGMASVFATQDMVPKLARIDILPHIPAIFLITLLQQYSFVGVPALWVAILFMSPHAVELIHRQ